jgi:lipopolysaccharide transport system permease protein
VKRTEEADVARVHEISADRFPLLRLRELWEYRELIGFLVWRDLALRYKQTALGVAWAVIQPVLLAGVFAVVLGRWISGPSSDTGYFVFAFAGLVPWQLFMHALTTASNSLVQNERLVTRVYVPRIAIPLAGILAAVLDLAIGMVVLLVIMAASGIRPPAQVALLPLVVAWLILAAGGVALLLASLNVRYRDVRYAVPFMSQVWLFATPVLYPIEAVPARLHGWIAINPMVGIVETFRALVLGGPVRMDVLGPSFVGTVLVAFAGLLYFRWAEREFADVI